MKTLVILTPGFPKNEEDTTCLPAFQQFVLSLKKLNPQLQIIIITFQYPFDKKKYNWNGINVISLGGKNQGGIKRLLIWARAYRALKQIKKQFKQIGLLSLWLGECACLANLFAKRKKIKHFVWIIGQDAKRENKYVRRIKPKPNQLVAMSDFLQEEFFKNHKIKPSYIIENGINEADFPLFNNKERTIDVLGVGSLTPLKNYNLFIDIISDVKKIIPNINAVIIGSGEQHFELEAKIILLGLQNNVLLLGLQPHSDVFNYMNNSKIFLHTSYYEGNSTVLMEALYSGCYTFSTQALSNSLTPNLAVVKKKSDFVQLVTNKLREPNINTKRIVFNNMDSSANRMLNFFK
jgi:glycosyltransferase involved in cell wall biosynthesis